MQNRHPYPLDRQQLRHCRPDLQGLIRQLDDADLTVITEQYQVLMRECHDRIIDRLLSSHIQPIIYAE